MKKEVGQKYRVTRKDIANQFEIGEIVTLKKIGIGTISYYENDDGRTCRLYDVDCQSWVSEVELIVENKFKVGDIVEALSPILGFIMGDKYKVVKVGFDTVTLIDNEGDVRIRHFTEFKPVEYETFMQQDIEVPIDDIIRPNHNKVGDKHTWDYAQIIAEANPEYTKSDAIMLGYMFKHIPRAGRKLYPNSDAHQSKIYDLKKCSDYLNAWIEQLENAQ